MLFAKTQLQDHQVEEYKNRVSDYWRSSKPDLTNSKS